MPADVVLVVGMPAMGVGVPPETFPLAGYKVHFVRLRSEADRELHVSGRPLAQMPKGSVLLSQEVYPPMGAAPDHSPSEPGHSMCRTLEEATQLAKLALANQNSEARIAGVDPNTLIYLWKKGNPPKRLD